jgi:acyl-CoA synthetase (AMP-forming)/AMP-acid ligase II
VNIAMWLERARRRRPAHRAIVREEVEHTYAEVGDRVARLAGYFSAGGLERGDRIGILLKNDPRLLETLFAIFHGGYVAVPVNARSTPHEASAILEHAGVRAIVYGPEYVEHVSSIDGEPLLVGVVSDSLAAISFEDAISQAPGPLPLAELRPDALAWLFYTSGTTGLPKGAMLTHGNLAAMVMNCLADVQAFGSDSVVLHAAPLTHGSGLYALPALARGTTQVLTASPSFDPDELVYLIGERGITEIAFLAPTMVKWLVEACEAAGAQLEGLESIIYGGAPMYLDDLERALDVLGPVLTQIYGQAEAPVTISCLTRAAHRRAHEHGEDHLMSAGRPYVGVEAAVFDGRSVSMGGEGEILTRSDVVMAGYWRDERATQECLHDGWLHTGDLGRIDEDGFLYLLDRTKDMIISGGANIYPREVEEVILAHPGVRQVAVIGVPDEEWGERVVAVVTLNGDARPDVVERELEARCLEKLSRYKRPRRYEWRSALPTSAYGKILKRELREEFWQGVERRI